MGSDIKKPLFSSKARQGMPSLIGLIIKVVIGVFVLFIIIMAINIGFNIHSPSIHCDENIGHDIGSWSSLFDTDRPTTEKKLIDKCNEYCISKGMYYRDVYEGDCDRIVCNCF